MQNKFIKALIIILIASAAFSQQEKTEKPAETQKQDTQASEVNTSIPVQSKFSNNFKIDYISFNKRIDLTGRGELIEFSFILKNNLDAPQEFYIWTVATYENVEKTRSSFEPPIEEKDRMLNFSTFPDEIKSFEYTEKNKSTGKEKTVLIKHPKNPKNGVNPDTGKPYQLKDKLLVTTKHLSRYRNNYKYYNNFTLLIFDNEGKLVFRQLYKFIGWRK